MRSKNINKDGAGNGADSDFINRVLERLRELQFYDSQTVRVEQTTRGTRFHAKIPPATGGSGGYMGEYDPTKAYAVGQTFKISTDLVINGATIVAGYYGVGPAATAVDAQGFGPFAGYLPANPAASGIDMDKLFFNPENPLPTFGAAPNDKLYADLIEAYC